MRFTKYQSLEDILRYPNMEEYLNIFYSDELLELYPRQLWGEPIAYIEQIGKVPWAEPFSVIADQLMDAANLVLDLYENKTRRCISLWREEEKDWTLQAEKQGGKEQVFLVTPEKLPAEKRQNAEKKPTVIICPGGGYGKVYFCGEGTPIMHRMEANGYAAFILRYRVAPERYPGPQEDLALAIQYVRAHAEEYGVDVDNITLIGASAGAHLCASEAALYEEMANLVEEEVKTFSPELAKTYKSYSARPDKLVLSYPVISLEKEQHEGSFQNLTGGKEELRSKLSVENLVTEGYPPTFVWACEDDNCVPPSNAKRMEEVLKQHNIPSECHIYPQGGHGCGLAFSHSAAGWSKAMLLWLP